MARDFVIDEQQPSWRVCSVGKSVPDLPRDPGAYCVAVRIRAAETIRVGALGEFIFPPGAYLYAGSAMGGLRGRLARHLRSSKILKWHIDYLIDRGQVVAIGWIIGDDAAGRLECALANRLTALGARPPIRGFGSSDCSCEAHLFAIGKKSPTRILTSAFSTLSDF